MEVGVSSGVTVNVSTAGVYFQTPAPVAPEQEIAIVYPFELTAQGARAACRAQVTRVEALADGFGVAAKYDQIAFVVPARE